MNGPTHIWSRPVVGYYPGKEGSERDVLGIKGRMRLPKQMIFRKRFCHYKQACGILPRKRGICKGCTIKVGRGIS